LFRKSSKILLNMIITSYMLQICWNSDFNEALFQSEHFSSRRRNEGQMLAFRETLDFCNLHDLGFFGVPWTYNNKQ
jgi:hypothetical protein